MKSITDILKRQVKWMKTLELKRKMGNAGSFLLEKIKQYPKQKQQNRIPEYEVSAGTGLAELESAIESDSNFVFLNLYTTTGNSIPSFMSFIALLGPFVGLALGFDAINSERSAGTLNRLVAQPIYRDFIIIGKFLAGLAVIAMMVFSMGIFIGAIGILTTGLVPEGEEILRIFVFLVFTVIYIAFWLSLSILFSVLCRHSATSALSVIALWIFFTIFMSLLADIIAGAVFRLIICTAKQWLRS